MLCPKNGLTPTWAACQWLKIYADLRVILIVPRAVNYLKKWLKRSFLFKAIINIYLILFKDGLNSNRRWFHFKRVESHNQPDSKRVFIDNVQPNQNSIRLEK